MQYQILQDMKQKAGPMFGVSKQVGVACWVARYFTESMTSYFFM